MSCDVGLTWSISIECSFTSKVVVFVQAKRMSVDMHRRSEFQGERGYFLGHFTDFAVFEIVEKGGSFVKGLKYHCFAEKSINLNYDFSLFSHKNEVKLLKISLEKESFSILRTTMEYPFFMEVPVSGIQCTLMGVSVVPMYQLIHSGKSPARPMLFYSTNYWQQF